jgi:uncharacterized membrane protein
MSDLVAIAYPDLATAQQVATSVGQLQKGHELELDDMVIVERKPNEKVKLHQPSTTGAGAASGALWGGLIGLLFLNPLLGMAFGAAGGAIGGSMVDYGIDDKFMKELGTELEPGGAALLLLIRKVSVDKVLPQIQVPGKVIQTSLDDETESRLSEALAGAGRT